MWPLVKLFSALVNISNSTQGTDDLSVLTNRVGLYSENMCCIFSEWDQRICCQEEQNRGKANWEHLNEDLHVLITVEDSENRAHVKLQKAVDEVKKLLVPMVSSGVILSELSQCGLSEPLKEFYNWN